MLLLGDEADGILVEARRRAFALDVGDEAVFIALAQRREIAGGAGIGHVTAPCRFGPGFGGNFIHWPKIAAGVIAASAVPTASLIRFQCGLVEQKSVRVQSGPWIEHCVTPMAPSIAATTSAIEMAPAGRARR